MGCGVEVVVRGCGECITYMLDESTLVLEGVTLAKMVEFVVEVLVDLAGGPILHKKTAENS